ncbi:hypothetical protein PPYR_02930 [Photinus pyralis]|uniref:Condensin complex subunit 1 n=4 Tax=Photinus pyralis TaxID=7054 RepID=A0A5N4A1C9_PHOPY|nr:condensin complex subunit 1 [Photinus pyralis]KAB0791130.1 hypothetical protein PPYR_02930 [Photinus pyralis]
MFHINFVIPQNKNELLSDNDRQYYVRNVISTREIQLKLREAKQCLKDEGPEFIFDNFDTYYSILHHADSLDMEIIIKSYEVLQKAMQELNNNLNFLLQDKDNLNEEFNSKYVNVLKMLVYVYSQTVILVEQKLESKRSQTLQQKGRQRKKQPSLDCYDFDKKLVLVTLSNVVQHEINLFWDPPVVEDTFITLVAEVCYRFLESSTIKSEKEVCTELLSTLGVLIKSYNHGMTFVVRIVQLIKIHDFLSHCVPQGIQLLVKNYHCKSLIRDFVQEITEWQTDEKFQDLQGGRNCAAVLFEMANLMPDLMIPEVMYLTRYLAHESYTLRNSVLHVITEVVLNVLTKNNLTEEQRESRDEFLSILMDHIRDTSALVRTKVFQHWSRLQQENAIPVKIQSEVLSRAVMHLRDKAANVRKTAASCVTTFLSHNIYSSSLQLDKIQKQLEIDTENLKNLKAKLEDSHVSKINELTEQWNSKEADLIAVITEQLQDEELMAERKSSQVSERHLPDLIRMYVLDNKFKEAFEICWAADALPEWEEMKDAIDEGEKVQMFATLIRTIFMDITSLNPDENSTAVVTESDLAQLVALETSVEFLTRTADFLRLIDSAIKPMSDLLESASVSDMQEAIEFFVTAYKFNINNALFGVLEMLKIMQRNEQERKDHVIDAFKSIYLTTDSTTMREHTTIIVERLINLLKIVPYRNYQDLTLIIAEWVSKSILDNSIIDQLWQYFTKKADVSDEHARAALTLLTMATMGRRTIGSKNIRLVAAVGFGPRAENDILLLKGACEFLQQAGREKQDITDSKPPFKIKANDPMWKSLIENVCNSFYRSNPFYNGMITSAIGCIYRLCSKPEKICEDLVENLFNSLRTELSNNPTLDGYLIIQITHLLGEIAVKELNFLDESVYKELKRRNYIREERKCTTKNKKAVKVKQVQNASALKRGSSNATNNQSSLADDSTAAGDESTLEGAQADDTDAEFILNVLENNTVSKTSGLGKLAPIIVRVCQQSDVYDDERVQGTAIIALLRYMAVSSKFCQQHMQLVFTILERTKYPIVKSNIMIHCSDLLERFPNIVEPWTPRMYERLSDPCVDVRVSTFFILANLILRDMLRVQGHISEMARCIVDEEEQLRDMSKTFFIQLSHKANNLYNILPDIFSHLCDNENLDEANLKHIMKFLFGLIDKNKQMENLVERFCPKFRLTDDNRKCRNIAYCLSLIQYNEKGLRNLIEGFGFYKNALLNEDVYSAFQQIVATGNRSTKNEIKALATELEQKISSVFDVDENGQQVGTPNRPPRPAQPKSAFKKPKGKAPLKRAKKKKVASDSDDSDSEGKENVRQTRRARAPPRVIRDEDSDSD